MAELTTQDFLEIKDIKEGVVVLKNNELRGVMAISSLNFALKSEEEKDAIIYGFQRFLNTLDFSSQIIVQSRKLNIGPYIETLEKLEREQKNELLKVQISQYMEFIKNLVRGSLLMSKSFYLVVPFRKGELYGAKEVLKRGIFEFGRPKETPFGEEEFKRAKDQLYQRMEYVAEGLRNCGLKAVPLTTLELIELFWAWYNPKEAEEGYYPEILPELLK